MEKLKKKFGHRKEKIKGNWLLDQIECKDGVNCVAYVEELKLLINGCENGKIEIYDLKNCYNSFSKSFDDPSVPMSEQGDVSQPTEEENLAEAETEVAPEEEQDNAVEETEEDHEVADNAEEGTEEEEAVTEAEMNECQETPAGAKTSDKLYSLVKSFKAHDEYIGYICVTDDAFITTGGDNMIKKWSLDTFELLFEVEGHEQAVTQIISLKDSFVTSGLDAKINIWNMASGEKFNTMEGHSKSIFCMVKVKGDEISGDWIISGSADGTARIWSMDKGKCNRIMSHGSKMVTQIVTDAAEKFLYTGTDDGTITTWKIRTGEKIHSYDEHKKTITCLRVFGQNIFSASLDSTCKCWHADSTSSIREFKRHGKKISDILIQGTLIFTACHDGKIRCFDFKTSKLKRIFDAAPNESLHKLLIISDKLLSISANSSVKIFTLRGFSILLKKK